MGLFVRTCIRAAFIVSVACLVMSVSAFSQGIATGSISATVTDPSGASLPGAHVKAVNASTNQEFAGDTSELGFITLRSLPPGFYKITITSTSFRTAVLDSVEVSVARDSSLGSVK